MFRLPACCAAASTSSGAGAVAAAGREAPGATLPSHIFRRAVPVVFPGCCVFTTHSLRCGCAGRSCRSHFTSQHHELMGARRTTRTRRVHPASSWRQSRTCMSLSCTPQHPSNLAHSDGTDGLTRDSSSERPLPADLCGLAQPASSTLVVVCIPDACVQPEAAGLRLESRCRRHVCAVPPRSSDHECSLEWPLWAARHDAPSTPCMCAGLGV